MKIWLDDIRVAPAGWRWIKTVDEAKKVCTQHITPRKELKIEMISLDHDAGDYGADYIELLNWLEQKQELCGWIIPTVFEIHSMNVVGAENMRRVIKHNNWKMN